ncbi:hypothetical protein AB2063_001986 [Clostridium botulinum]
MAKMETNFIIEKTNLSTNIKKELSDCVDNKINESLNDIYKAFNVFQKLQNVFAKEKGFLLDDITGEDSLSRLKELQERNSNTYDKFKNIKFDKNFMNNFLNIMKNINKQYSDNIKYYKDIDYKLESKTSNHILELQKTINDRLTSDWNDFIDKIDIKDNKSKYYLPSNDHNIINNFA